LSLVKTMLAHPATRGRDLDDPAVTGARRGILESKPFLMEVYRSWYAQVARALPAGDGPVVEIGSGAGFAAREIPGLISSEVFFLPHVDLVADALALPFARSSVRALVLVDVFHHLPDPARFLEAAAACVRPGGKILMVEPWVTGFSSLVYKNLHHEPFDPTAATWGFGKKGPLSGANQALAWIVFSRDLALFRERFPQWSLKAVQPRTPFAYLLSGGLSLRFCPPGWSWPLVRDLERAAARWMGRLAMFAFIELERTRDAG